MGQTLDDAAGEAYDKVAKMLGLGYPGGAVIDRLAASGDPGKVRFPRVYLDRETFDFSFSGIKTAVKRYIQAHDDFRNRIPDIAAGFQESVVEVLSYKLIRAASDTGCRHVAVVGGVAANGRLREKIAADAAGTGISVHIPPISLCGDNAAMIAAAGYHLLVRGEAFDWGADVFSRGR
jgi:N6-L-threonylcarbamoyladenine synthase